MLGQPRASYTQPRRHRCLAWKDNILRNRLCYILFFDRRNNLRLQLKYLSFLPSVFLLSRLLLLLLSLKKLIELLGVALDSPGLNFHADCRCLFLRILTLWLRDDSLGVNRHRLSVRVCHFAFEHLSDCSWGQRLFLHLIFITLCRFTDLWTALLDCLDLLLALLVGSLEYFQKVIILCD